ncbi:unnamed protein product [Aphanomyces euteiches]
MAVVKVANGLSKRRETFDAAAPKASAQPEVMHVEAANALTCRQSTAEAVGIRVEILKRNKCYQRHVYFVESRHTNLDRIWKKVEFDQRAPALDRDYSTLPPGYTGKNLIRS